MRGRKKEKKEWGKRREEKRGGRKKGRGGGRRWRGKEKERDGGIHSLPSLIVNQL